MEHPQKKESSFASVFRNSVTLKILIIIALVATPLQNVPPKSESLCH